MKITGELNQLSRAVRLLITCACLASMPALSHAQDNNKPVASDDQEQITLAPVTVTITAQKDSELALSVPLSVTAVIQDSLTDANIQGVKQAADYVPIAIPYAQMGAPSGYIGESGAPRTYGFRLGLNY